MAEIPLTQRPHAVIVPQPAQGHLIPMLKVAKLLYHKGFYITFVNTEYNERWILQARGPKALEGIPGFRFASISDGIPADADTGDTQNQYAWVFCDYMMKDSPLPYFRDLISKLNSSPDVPPITCIVTDGVMTFPRKVAEELDIPVVFFWTTSACGFLAYCFFNKLLENGLIPLKDESCLTNGYLDTAVDFIPAMEGIRLKDLPIFVRTTNPEDVMLRFCVSETGKADKCSAHILNTFDALERKSLDALSSFLPPIYPIGPLQLLEEQVPLDDAVKSIRLNLWKENLECLSWLDSKEANSVIYVNFGSVARLTSQQLIEYAWGLANSKQNFLWVIRPDLVIGAAATLPPEFEAEIKDRGLILSWCPQEQVLSHPAVGGFLTHAGWNSILESLCAGVPMICWPAYAEQPTNAWFICREWDVGTEINEVSREEVGRLVREMMAEEKGKQMKKKAMEWKKLAQEACSAPDGSSYRNFDRMVEEVLLSKFQK